MIDVGSKVYWVDDKDEIQEGLVKDIRDGKYVIKRAIDNQDETYGLGYSFQLNRNESVKRLIDRLYERKKLLQQHIDEITDQIEHYNSLINKGK